MEYVLLIIVIILLFFQNSKHTKDSYYLKREINNLNEKLNNLHYLLKTNQETRSVEKKNIKEDLQQTTVEPAIDAPLKTASAVFKEPEEQYIPNYPSVTKLSKKDINLIKDIFTTAKDSNDTNTLIKLRNKMMEVLNIKQVKEKTDTEFISAILKDINYYAKDKQSDKSASTKSETKKETPIQPVPVSDSSKTVMSAAPKKEPAQEPTLSIWEKFKQRNPDLEKFVGENLINKIGILILVLGISYFVKFAIDKNWINEPARVGIGVLSGSLVLFIAHKLRKKYAPFSSVLVAGAIAIFYFTTAIAFHEYKLFGQEVAFTIMVVITAFSSLISLSYDRMELAILSLIGGFLVPFMVSTGSGNYIVLFTFIAILNMGILTLAYFKKWHLVNILAFIFTMLLFVSWVVQETWQSNPHYLGALIFGFIFYIIFIITNIINNLRTKGVFTKMQLAILAINNFVFYGIGMLVLSEFAPNYSGLFTTFLALLNMGYSFLFYKKFGLDKTAVYLLIGLSLTFITLAIPVQFSGNNITIFWAIEAVLLMWLSQKSEIKSYRFAAVLVHFLMVVSLIMDWTNYAISSTDLAVVINPTFIGGIMVVASLVAVGYLLRQETEKFSKFGLVFSPVEYRKITKISAIIIGYLVGLFEVGHQSSVHFAFDAFASMSLFYHFLFSAVVCFILFGKRSIKNDKIINIITITNILVFAFILAEFAFSEHQENILSGSAVHLAYYIHMLSLFLIGYFWYLVYNTNKAQKVFSILGHELAIWSAVFVLVVLASTELVLQGLHLMDFSLDMDRLGNDYVSVYHIIDSARYKIIKAGLPVLWGVIAFILLLWGIKKQIKQLRIIALTLLGLTIVKLFVYDISNVSETGKIVAFILLGILILIISFVYQKIKVLVIDDDKKIPKNDKID
ncbi:DUF2339 domain-containing protein [Tamlana flava]|uniref:DUF2339 domain-containing protein n=1 Tax=Tamlana flava TaxID=3158572 RepID=UPI00351B53E5